MLGRLRQIRPAERRDTLVASATLFALMAAHALLETTRDALFLASIPASRLPIVYIGVALVALAVSAIQNRGPGGQRALTAWLVLSAFITVGFWPLIGGGVWVLYALYIWSAVVVTVGLSRFFILLGTRFTASQAKRAYAVIGAGSVVGAIAGSAIASLLASILPASQLLIGAALALILSALGPMLLSAAPTPKRDRRSEQFGLVGQAREVVSHPYARRVATLLVLTTVVFTLVDYVFKSQVAHFVEPENLGAYFARVYLALNVLSLLVQLFVVRHAVRWVGPTGTLAALPALLFFGGIGVVVGGGVLAAVLLKGSDGSLRHSLHRTASELLFVPMSDRLRTASKIFIDFLGHRGAQAVASVAILAATAVGVSNEALGGVVVVLAALCVHLALRLRSHYLNVFRTTLAEAAQRTRVKYPELTLGTLESLIAALNHPDEQRVKVALQLFAEQDRAHLIPGLILYHPAPDVLAEALDLLAASGRTDFIPLADRLHDHEYAHVRSAALRARMAVAPDEALLREKVDIACPVVRATALVGLTAGGFATIEETGALLDEVIDTGSSIAKEALARAISYAPSPVFWDYLIRLADSSDDEVLLTVARSMAKSPTPCFLPVLLSMLGRRPLRPQVRASLLQIGEPASAAIEVALADGTCPREVLIQLPKALVRFPGPRAAAILQTQLVVTTDSVLRYKILRALHRVVSENPNLVLDRAPLNKALAQNLRQSFSYISQRNVLIKGAVEFPARETAAHGYLIRMLRDKEENTIERAFRLIGILAPEQDVRTIFRGLSLPDADVRASSRELLESFVPPRFRDALLGLIDELPDDGRLQAAGAFRPPPDLDYGGVLFALRESESNSLASLASYHVSELGLEPPTDPDEKPGRALAVAANRATEWLKGPETEGAV